MTQIVENWSRVVGRVEAWDPPAEPDKFGTLRVRVETITDVPSQRGTTYKNLLAGNEGQSLRILVPAAAVTRLNPVVGQPIEIDVRRTRSADRVFARAEPFKDRR